MEVLLWPTERLSTAIPTPPPSLSEPPDVAHTCSKGCARNYDTSQNRPYSCLEGCRKHSQISTPETPKLDSRTSMNLHTKSARRALLRAPSRIFARRTAVHKRLDWCCARGSRRGEQIRLYTTYLHILTHIVYPPGFFSGSRLCWSHVPALTQPPSSTAANENRYQRSRYTMVSFKQEHSAGKTLLFGRKVSLNLKKSVYCCFYLARSRAWCLSLVIASKLGHARDLPTRARPSQAKPEGPGQFRGESVLLRLFFASRIELSALPLSLQTQITLAPALFLSRSLSPRG